MDEGERLPSIDVANPESSTSISEVKREDQSIDIAPITSPDKDEDVEISTRKRKRIEKKVKSFIEYPGGDWIISGSIASTATTEILKLLVSDQQPDLLAIFLPGVGYSALPLELYTAGYTKLTLLDIEESSIDKQTKDFVTKFGYVPKSVQIIKSNALIDGFKDLVDKSFDVIVDKGFMDVFLRQGHSTTVWKALLPLLKPETGFLVIFSIFHSKWKRYLTQDRFEDVTYSSIEVKRYSKTRPSVSSFSYPGALFIAQQKILFDIRNTGKLSVSEASEFQDFKMLRSSDFPPDASHI